MKILINNEIDKNIWNKFVNNRIFFRYEWLFVIKDSYKLEPLFIMCYEGDKFAIIGSFKTHKGYISLPFVSYSGFLSNDEEMLQEIKKYLKKNNIVIDSRDLLEKEATKGYVNPIVSVPSYEEFWKNISSNTRNQFNKSMKSELVFTKEDTVDNFYKLYSLGMRNLGTPSHGKKYFYKLNQYFNVLIFTIFDNDKAIGSMFCLSDYDTMAVLYAYVLQEYSKKYANYYMYLNAIKWMSKNDLKFLDMGRSTYGEGTFYFKKKFRPKFYTINSNINYTTDTKMQLASKIWKKLPLQVANFIAPKVRKYLP